MSGPSEQRVVAFLRGINLGNRRLKMDALQRHFEAMGLERVATYLASGNVIFDALEGEGPVERPPAERVVREARLEAEVEAHLAARLGYDVDTFIRTLPQLAPIPALDGVVAATAEGFKPHVIFLKEEVDDTVVKRLEGLETADDRFRPLGREVIWLRRGGLSDSPISTADLERALGGRTSTLRTLNTVRRLVAKFGAEA